MPKLVQFPVFSPQKNLFRTVADVQHFLDTFVSAMQKFWTTQAYFLNALSRTGTASERPTAANAIHNDTFYTETDSNQTFVVIDGVYTSLGEQRDVQSFAVFMS